MASAEFFPPPLSFFACKLCRHCGTKIPRFSPAPFRPWTKRGRGYSAVRHDDGSDGRAHYRQTETDGGALAIFFLRLSSSVWHTFPCPTNAKITFKMSFASTFTFLRGGDKPKLTARPYQIRASACRIFFAPVKMCINIFCLRRSPDHAWNCRSCCCWWWCGFRIFSAWAPILPQI